MIQKVDDVAEKNTKLFIEKTSNYLEMKKIPYVISTPEGTYSRTTSNNNLNKLTPTIDLLGVLQCVAVEGKNSIMDACEAYDCGPIISSIGNGQYIVTIKFDKCIIVS